MHRTAFLGLMVLLVVGTYFFIARASLPGAASASEPVVGQWQSGRDQPAPDFALATLSGETFRLSEQRGKVVVLNFWATWCPPCREEIPDFVALQHEFRDRGVVFVGVSEDEEGEAVVRPFAEEYGINYPIVFDDGTLTTRFEGVTGYPTTYLIDQEGRILAYMPGGLTQAELRPILLRLVDGQAG